MAKQTRTVKPPEESLPLVIRNTQDLYEIMLALKGGNPKAQQILNNFLDFESVLERSNFPNLEITQMMATLKMASVFFYQDTDLNPFKVAYESAASSLMALKSKKSDQFVDMTKQTPAIAELTTQGGEKPSLRERLFGRKKEE